MKEYRVRITDQSGQSARVVFRMPLIGKTTWEVLDAGRLSVTGGTVDMMQPKAYLAHERELEARKDAWRGGEIAKANTIAPMGMPRALGGAPMPPGRDPFAHLAARMMPAPPMTSAPSPDWMHALLQVDDCLWNSASHMKSSHPNHGTAMALSAFLNKQFMNGTTRTGAGLLYHKYVRGLRPGVIKWEIEAAPCRLQLGDEMQSWPKMDAVERATRMAADLPGAQMFQ